MSYFCKITSLCMLLYCTLPTRSATKEFAFVDGGSLASLCSVISVPDQLKTDFLESTLYAQINSSLKFDRQENGTNWYVNFMAILQHIGWNVSLSEFEIYNTGSVFNWKKSIETIINQDLNHMEMVNLDNVLTSFFRLPVYNGSVKIFDELSHKGDISTFQIIPAFVDRNGNLVATFGLFTIIKMEQKGTTYDSQATAVIPSISVGVLNEKIYSKYRVQVQRQIAEYPKEYIHTLNK